jgi:hypothetical protein
MLDRRLPKCHWPTYHAGLQGAGYWQVCPRAQAGGAIDGAAIDTAGFRFAKLTSINDRDLLPGLSK